MDCPIDVVAEQKRQRMFLRRAIRRGGKRRPAGAAAAGGASIADLHFEPSARFRPFALVSPEFVQIDVLPPLGLVEGVVRTEQTPVAPYAAIELRVEELSGATVVAGLMTGSADHVLGRYDALRGEASIEVRVAGHTTVLRQQQVDLVTPCGFAFVLCENQVTALADSGQGWQPLLTCRDEVAALVDLRDEAELSRHSYAYGACGDRPAGITRVRAGYFGMAGLRDPHLVQLPDGTPYSPDGRSYLTFTCAGLGFFQQAHWGVFALDPADPVRLEQVAQLFFRRDGHVLGDHAGQLVWDPEHERFVVVVSAWGDFDFSGVHVRHTVTSADLLRGVHVLDSEPLDLPTALSSWDPALSRIGDRWHIGFVESPRQQPFDFHPALAVGQPGADYDGPLQLVGADRSRHQCEGTVLVCFEGQWFLLASDKDAQRYAVYDLDMRLLGSLDAPYGSNIPHPQVVPVPDGGPSRCLLVTFDGTQYGEDVLGYGGHGDVVVMAAE